MNTDASSAETCPLAQRRDQSWRFLGGILERFSSWCVDRGLSPSKVRQLLTGLRKLARWFGCKHKRHVEDLSEDDIGEARRFYRLRAPPIAMAAVALGEFLTVEGHLKPGQPLREFRPRVWRLYRHLPVLGRVLDEYARWCVRRGFSAATIRLHLDGLRGLARWLARRGKRSIADLSAADLEHARRYYRVRKPWFAASIRGLGRLLTEQGRLKRGTHLTPGQKELARFAAHLQKDCALAQSTIISHCFYARRFVKFIGGADSRIGWGDLKLSKINRFVRSMARCCRRLTMAHVVGMLRKLLRFEFLKGALREPLHLRLDSVRMYRQEQLAHPLPWAQLQKLLGLMDRGTALGLRDFAMLLLAASYGLRRSEVAALKLDDIDWRHATLRLTQPKTGQSLLLPLTDAVAQALVDYLRHGRPATAERRVFLRVRPPVGALGVTGVAGCLRRAVRATGVEVPHPHFHALRHAFALRLLLQGTGIKHISEVLGHRCLQSTSAYLRLDVEDLRQVALPVPRALGAAQRAELGHDSVRGNVCSGRRSRPQGTVTRPGAKGFESFLARSMRDFLAVHRALGRSYRGEEWILRNLDLFLATHHAGGRVFTAAMFRGWARQQAGVLPRVRCGWMSLVRKFCLHLARCAPNTYVPDSRSFPRPHPHPAPCLLSPNEVARLLAAALQKPGFGRVPEHPLHRHTMRLAVLLLYCCGLRCGELLRLRLEDIDTDGQLLRIIQSKFHKTRLVPLSASVSQELLRYLGQRRHSAAPMEPSAPLIWSARACRRVAAFSGCGLRSNWHQICRYAGVLDHRGWPPRLHDLRHSFAVTVLQRAYATGGDPQVTLPRLARYMGHAGFEFTHYYLQFTEPLRIAASERFQRLMAPMLGSPFIPSSKDPVYEPRQRPHPGSGAPSVPR